ERWAVVKTTHRVGASKSRVCSPPPTNWTTLDAYATRPENSRQSGPQQNTCCPAGSQRRMPRRKTSPHAFLIIRPGYFLRALPQKLNVTVLASTERPVR